MSFGQGLAFVFDESFTLVRRAWWLALAPAIPSLAYELSIDVLPSAYVYAAYWSSGILSAILYAATTYWVIRFIALEHDLSAALDVNLAAARTFAPYFMASLIFDIAFQIWGYLHPEGWQSLVFFFFPLVTPWIVTAPSGSTVIGPLQSIRLVAPLLIWAIAFILVLFIPISLVSWTAAAAFDSVPDLSIGGLVLNAPISAIVQTLIEAFAAVVLLAAAFAIASRAGVRVDTSKAIGTVFD